MKPRWIGDLNNPNRDLSDPDWISVDGIRSERSLAKLKRDLIKNEKHQ